MEAHSHNLVIRREMSRKNVFHGCQLRVKGICAGDDYVGKFEEHHLIPKAWQRKHPEATSRIKGGRDLTLMLCPNCHRWIHEEIRKRLGNEPSEQKMYSFVEEILQRKYY